MWTPEPGDSWGSLHCTWSEDPQRGFGSGAVKASPATSTKATTAMFSKGTKKEQDRWQPSSPLSLLWIWGDTTGPWTRGRDAEVSSKTHPLPMGTYTPAWLPGCVSVCVCACACACMCVCTCVYVKQPSPGNQPVFIFNYLHTLYINTYLAPVSGLQDAMRKWEDKEGN